MSDCSRCKYQFTPRIQAMDGRAVYEQLARCTSQKVRVVIGRKVYPVQEVMLILGYWVWWCDQIYKKDTQLELDAIQRKYLAMPGPTPNQEFLEVKLPDEKWGFIHRIVDDGHEILVYVNEGNAW